MSLVGQSDFLRLYYVGESASSRSKTFEIRNLLGGSLGRITWFVYQYVFNPDPGTLLYDSKNLRQISDWCDEKTLEHGKVLMR